MPLTIQEFNIAIKEEKERVHLLGLTNKSDFDYLRYLEIQRNILLERNHLELLEIAKQKNNS